MPEKDVSQVLSEKGQEIKKMFKDFDATLEQWKFSVEDNKDGTIVEIHARALIKKKEK